MLGAGTGPYTGCTVMHEVWSTDLTAGAVATPMVWLGMTCWRDLE